MMQDFVKYIGILTFAVIVAVLLFLCNKAAEAATEQPNFIAIVLDDAGVTDPQRFNTPNINNIGKFGVTYTSFYGGPMCSPARAALATGRYPERYGIDNALGYKSTTGVPASEETLAESLKKLGYTTALVGKQHLGQQPEFLPNNQGYDYFFGMVRGELRSYDTHLTKDGSIDWWRNRNRLYVKEYTTTAITREAVAFIDRTAAQKKPFYLHVAYEAPHVPWQLPGARVDSSNPGVYGQMLTMVDNGIKQIVNKLHGMGIADNTYIFVSGDNGGLNGHNGNLRGIKGTVFEGGTRIFAVMEGPNIPPHKDNVPRSLLDIYPTFVRLAGGTPKVSHDGRDLLNGDNSTRYMYWSMQGVNMAVRYGDWKFATQGGVDYLFNLAEDPSESNNRVNMQPGFASELKNNLHEWHNRVFLKN